MNLKHLISGTDIRGIVSKFEDREINLSGEEVKFIAKGFGLWIEKNCGKQARNENRKIKIAVGYDARLTGTLFSQIIRNVLKNMGIDVYNCGMSITPSLFMTTIFDEYKVDGAVKITASHLPSYYNGLKFFSLRGGLEKEEVVELLELSKNNPEFIEVKDKGIEIEKELANDYAKYLVDLIKTQAKNGEKPLQNLKIVVDAGNGAAGFIAENVIAELGGDITGSQFLNPDGNFPNHVPNPEAKEAIESIKQAVLKNNADFGIIFDADGDRSAFIDQEGREINRNNLIALLAEILIKETPKATIVTDSVTSIELKKFIEKREGKHHRFQRGYKNVINEAKRLNDEGIYTPLAIETSGHAAFIDNYFLDDGAYMAARLLIQLVKSKQKGVNFTDVLNEIKEPIEEKELRFKIKELNNFREIGNEILKDLKEYVLTVSNWELEIPNYEGIRVNVDKENWFLLRLSLHEPLLCLNIETTKKGKVEEILIKLKEFLSLKENIDISNL